MWIVTFVLLGHSIMSTGAVRFFVPLDSNAHRRFCSWIGIRLDTLGQIFTASLAFYLVYGPLSSNPSLVGFIISQAGMLALPNMCNAI